jgi:hypothetical protein
VRVLLAAFVLVIASPAVADRIKVAVVPGVAVNLDAARVDALSQDLAEALNAELEVDAIGGLEVRRQLPADGLPPDCVANSACIADVAKRLGAAQLLFVVMVDTGGTGAVQIDSTWVEPATGKTVSRPAIDLATIPEAKAKFAASATQLLPDAPVKPKPKGGIGGTMAPAVPRHFTTPAKLTTGLAVAGLGTGIVFALRARSRYNECDIPNNPCGESEEKSIRNNALVADAGFAVAILAAAGTAVLWWTSGSEARLIVSPEGQGTGASISMVGRF